MKKILLILVVIFLVSQFVPINRTNPETDPNNEIQANGEVKQILKRSCFDCHSNETVWPWYSYISPIKFLVEHDVEEGRSELNFSEWNKYSKKKKKHKLEEIIEEIEEGEMPLDIYLVNHSDAEIKESEFKILKSWVNSELAKF